MCAGKARYLNLAFCSFGIYLFICAFVHLCMHSAFVCVWLFVHLAVVHLAVAFGAFGIWHLCIGHLCIWRLVFGICAFGL